MNTHYCVTEYTLDGEYRGVVVGRNHAGLRWTFTCIKAIAEKFRRELQEKYPDMDYRVETE